VRAAVVRPPGAAPAAAALLTLTAAVVVIVFGVIATSSVYGGRMAWLLGVALPLLAASMVLSWLARRALAGTAWRGRRVNDAVFFSALSLFGIPPALAVIALAAYGLLLARHGVSLLF
jgi:membrane protein YqaA with SNARE-associated domain